MYCQKCKNRKASFKKEIFGLVVNLCGTCLYFIDQADLMCEKSKNMKFSIDYLKKRVSEVRDFINKNHSAEKSIEKISEFEKEFSGFGKISIGSHTIDDEIAFLYAWAR